MSAMVSCHEIDAPIEIDLRAALANRDTVSRAREVNAAIDASVGPWKDLFRSSATYGLALATAASAPTMPVPALVTIGKLGAWICAFDDFADSESVDDEALELRISQYENLVRGNACSELAFDPVARLFVAVVRELRAAPLGPALWPVFSQQLSSSLNAMRWERTAVTRERGGDRVPLELYLQHASDSVCVGIVATAAAMLLGERAILGQVPLFLSAQRHASIAVRLANDNATWEREQHEGSANAHVFGDDDTVGSIDGRTDAEMASLEVDLVTLRFTAPLTSEFLQRVSRVLRAIYRCGDLDHIR